MTLSYGNGHAERSAALFNNRHLVAVVGAIAQIRNNDEFTTRRIAVATSLPDSLVRPVIQRLFTAGILEEVHRSPGPRGATYFRTAEKTGWAELKALCRTVSKGDV
ncbi:transcriptional regulator, BadM/Rrf2 family [Mycolicibacterium canariasense]|uniref:Transcriptional regulator, BadM/Rrf2 family n=1 Tax=Mycolicibacterium canariasense TaxID=228230 RepID=A0A100WHW5_MYCCR|nr:hypothetical protein [Mycolicibacterium canariasense]MCV7211160.1 hypothetical protein [Mycolicibacterium canariasense]GAS98592.1 transcriptional regulator, BadM/Rrf2 family [Mycolicibacterium canariasense]